MTQYRVSRVGVVALVLGLALGGCAFQPPDPGRQVAPSVTVSAPAGVGTPGVPQVVPTPTPSTPPALPNPAVLAKTLQKVPTKNLGATGVVVADAAGEQLYANGDKPLQPASTMKILTTMTALDLLGPDTRFETRVVQVDAGTIALVGGGDPFLMTKPATASYKPASLEALAKSTAAALGNRKSVNLVYDASLFSGSGWGSAWRDRWKKTYPRVSALTVNRGMATKWTAAGNPAKFAAQEFVKELAAVKVKVSSVKAGKAPGDGAVLASVASAPVWVIVQRTLRVSDNIGAEVLARHAGRAASGNGSFAGGSAAIRDWLTQHGMPQDKNAIDGGSGLSLATRVNPGTLTKTLALAVSDPRYAPVLRGLPVAGANGTLKKRFNDKNEAAARNVVHAKTGALDNVSTLAGYLVDKDGATLVFAAMANKTNGHDNDAHNWLDRTAAILATCGCR